MYENDNKIMKINGRPKIAKTKNSIKKNMTNIENNDHIVKYKKSIFFSRSPMYKHFLIPTLKSSRFLEMSAQINQNSSHILNTLPLLNSNKGEYNSRSRQR